MIKLIKKLIYVAAIILVAGVAYHYLNLHQSDELKDANHAEEIGEGIGNTIDTVKETYDEVKNSEEVNQAIDDFKDGYSKKDSL